MLEVYLLKFFWLKRPILPQRVVLLTRVALRVSSGEEAYPA